YEGEVGRLLEAGNIRQGAMRLNLQGLQCYHRRTMSSLRQNAEAQQILNKDAEFLMPVYPRYPVVMERGEGVYLFDSTGNRYLDLMGGLGVNALGHAH